MGQLPRQRSSASARGQRLVRIAQLPQREGSERPTADAWIVSGIDVGQAVVAFAVLQPDYEPDEDLRVELEKLVTQEMGKPLAPKEVRFVRDIPKTRNAKVMRRVIRSAYLGEPPGDLSALVNPEAVEEIRGAM